MDKDQEKLVKEVTEFFDQVASWESTNRETWLEDIRFYSGEQWPEQIKRMRENDPNGPRPCLTINKLPLHVRQVTNDVRQNSPAIKVHPVDDKADVKLAEVLNGVIRHIEYQSDADVAYQVGNENQVVAGVGYWRVIAEVQDEETNQQDIYIRPIHNIFTVYFDPSSECPVGSDAERVLITSEMTRHEFEEAYPDADTAGFTQSTTGDKANLWGDEKVVRIAEYWKKEEKVTNYLLISDGTQMTEEEYWEQWQGVADRPYVMGRRQTSTERVYWYKTNGKAILESGEWAGKYIPIVRVPGEIINIEGKPHFRGLIYNAKDPMRMYNYWVSAETEMIALQPKAPFIGAAGVFDGFEDKWAAANTANLAYLEYNAIDANGNPAPMPQRQGFSGSPTGVLNAKAGAADDIKATTGQFDASLGMRSNETSGKAIMARQREGDTGTYHFIDNMGKAIRHTGRIIIDLIPKIYDTARVLRIVGEDESVSHAMFDPSQQQAVRKIKNPLDGTIKTIYNPSIGKYDVTVSIGPSYNTKRAEAFDAMTQLVQGNPQLWPIIGDLIVKNMDWPGADGMAKRLKAMLPPQVAQLEQEEESPLPPEAMQQIQQMQEQLQQFQQGIHDATQGIQQRDQEIARLNEQLKAKEDKAEIEEMKVEVEGYRAHTERLKTEAEIAASGNVEMLTAKVAQLEAILAHLISPPETEIENEPPEGGFFTPEMQ